MKSRKTTDITIETHEVWVIRRQSKTPVGCAECDGQFTMVTVDQAVDVTHFSALVIYRWVEGGQIHFLETAEGKLLVCLNSLPS
jgi:hypothetical protein